MRTRALARFIFLFLQRLLVAVTASDITLFTDAKCSRSWRAVDTVNGYPDGLCKMLNVAEGQSFQIQGLDPGCAVTLYGKNAGNLACSSTAKIVGLLGTCYDSSWVYYSIDGCLPPNSSSTIVSSVNATATGLSTSHVASETAEPKVQTGVIVGSTVAGVSGVVLGVAGIWFVIHCRRRRRIYPAKLTHELSEDRAVAESDAASEKKTPKELWGGHAAVEMGRNSRFEGMMRDAEPVGWSVNPLIQIRFVP